MKESEFCKLFADTASLLKCKVVDIPDTKMINANNRHFNKEKRRPFDFILVTPTEKFFIEAKVAYRKQKDHQIATENWLGSDYYVIRRRKTKKRGAIYSVEQKQIQIYETQDISGLVKYFISGGNR